MELTEIELELLRCVERDRDKYIQRGLDLKATTSNEIRFHQVMIPFRMDHDMKHVVAYVHFHFAEEKLYEICYHLVLPKIGSQPPKCFEIPGVTIDGPQLN